MKRTFLGSLIWLAMSLSAVGQVPSTTCRPDADERRIFEVLIRHFQVMAGTVEIRPYDKPLATERYSPDVAAIIADFNHRNVTPCPGTDGPLAGIRLLAGSQNTQISRAGFDVPRTRAFIEITLIGGPEIGSGHYVILKKDAADWQVAEERQYRMF
jgi:hypothetical protein